MPIDRPPHLFLDRPTRGEYPCPNHLLIFTRYPVPGQTKTRLIPALGKEGAALLQRRLTEHCVAIARQLTAIMPLKITVAYTGGTGMQMQQWLGGDLHYHPQGDGNLGDRLWQAFQMAFTQGSEKVMAIGSDCPFLSPDLLHTALIALDTNHVVIGPAQDGGYYLLGLKSPNAPAANYFHAIDWGTEQVYAQTLAKITQNGDRPYVLPMLSDIDRPEDLAGLPPHFLSVGKLGTV